MFRNGNEITSETGAGFLFIFKARKQAHSKLCNCFRNAEDGQKDKPVSDVIKFTFLTQSQNFNVILLLIALFPGSVVAGFSQSSNSDPRSQTFEGRPFSDEQKTKVIDAIKVLNGFNKGKFKACASCMASLLLNKNQRGEARPKLCVETNAQTNKENGATALPGRQSTKCNPKDDAVNVSPQMVNRSKEVLAAILAHECCHTKQDPKKISELPCCRDEFKALAALKKKADANAKADISKREEELTQYCCSAEIKELNARRSKASKKAKKKIDKRLAELEKICGKKKKPTTTGGGSEPGNDKPKVSGDGTSKIVQGEQANYSIYSDDSILFANLRSDANDQLKQFPLSRTQAPGQEISPIYMLLRNPDELPFSEHHALIISAYDELDDIGLIKTLEVADGEIMVEYPDIELPGVKPVDAAIQTVNAPSHRLFVFDDANDEILCLADHDADGLPETQISVFATLADFPALENTLSISLYGDGGDISLSKDDLRSDDYVVTPAEVIVLFDDNGDCIADYSETVEILPAPIEE